MKEAMQHGLPMRIFKKGSKNGLGNIAEEMAGDGHIVVPDGVHPAQHLVDLLRKKAQVVHADNTKKHESAIKEHADAMHEHALATDPEYRARHEEALAKGLSHAEWQPSPDVEKALGDEEATVHRENQARQIGEVDESDPTADEAADQGGSGGGDVSSSGDVSFDFGANESQDDDDILSQPLYPRASAIASQLRKGRTPEVDAALDELPDHEIDHVLDQFDYGFRPTTRAGKIAHIKELFDEHGEVRDREEKAAKAPVASGSEPDPHDPAVVGLQPENAERIKHEMTQDEVNAAHFAWAKKRYGTAQAESDLRGQKMLAGMFPQGTVAKTRITSSGPVEEVKVTSNVFGSKFVQVTDANGGKHDVNALELTPIPVASGAVGKPAVKTPTPAPPKSDNSFLAPGGQIDMITGKVIRKPRKGKGGVQGSLIDPKMSQQADVSDMEEAMNKMKRISNPEDEDPLRLKSLLRDELRTFARDVGIVEPLAGVSNFKIIRMVYAAGF